MDAALREACEEVGLRREFIEPILQGAVGELVKQGFPAARVRWKVVLGGGDGLGPSARLVEVVRAAVAASGVATRILRLRWVPPEALPVLLRQAQAVAYPSLEEGFGLPALEALACGTPLVTSAGSPMTDLAGDAALAVPRDDPAALALALAQLLDDEELAGRLRRLGPKVAGEYTWEESARRHLDAYRLAAASAP